MPVLSRPLSGGRRVRRGGGGRFLRPNPQTHSRSLAAWKIRGRPRHGTELGSAGRDGGSGAGGGAARDKRGEVTHPGPAAWGIASPQQTEPRAGPPPNKPPRNTHTPRPRQTRRSTPASPRPGPARWRKTASRPRPTRPGPQSQSLSRSYGSNLPTSLTYISLSTRGSSPWRPAADMGTSRRDTSA